MGTNIRSALLSDVNKIYEIAKENELDDSSDLAGHGFLVSGYSQGTYKKYIEENPYFYVIEEDECVVGFLLAFSQDALDMGLVVNQSLYKWASNPFMVIKQICIAQNAHRKGYGKALYEHFLSLTPKDVYLAIVKEPLNLASINFHQSLGFEEAYSIRVEDGMERLIYYKEHLDNVQAYDKDILLTQYEHAIHLYTHEDTLNWSKLNHLFYITAGLFGVFSFVMRAQMNNLFMYLTLGFVSFLGVASSYLFYMTVTSGMVYMHHRKESVMQIENILEKFGGVRIVARGAELDHRYNKSLTSLIMRRMPYLIMVIWMAIMAMIIVLGYRGL